MDAARALLEQLFFDPKRYDLTRVGRYKLNARLDLDIDLDTRVLTHDDIIALVKELVGLPKLLGIPEGDRHLLRPWSADRTRMFELNPPAAMPRRQARGSSPRPPSGPRRRGKDR